MMYGLKLFRLRASSENMEDHHDVATCQRLMGFRAEKPYDGVTEGPTGLRNHHQPTYRGGHSRLSTHMHNPGPHISLASLCLALAVGCGRGDTAAIHLSIPSGLGTISSAAPAFECRSDCVEHIVRHTPLHLIATP